MTCTARGRSRRFGIRTALAILGIVVLLAGCSNEGSSPTPSAPDPAVSERVSDGSATESPTPAGMQTIDLMISGDTLAPSGEPVEVRAGEKFALRITAGAALKGEIHVHSTPEQTFKYEGGTSAIVMSIDQPGLVDVEADDLGGVILQLRVV